MTDWLFLDPVDILNLRGNQLFGEAGAMAQAQMPPWPSVVAGALRSRMMADHKVDLAAFAQRGADGEIGPVLGKLNAPGSFRVIALLGGRNCSGTVEPLLPAPADWVVDANGPRRLTPLPLPVETSASISSLPLTPVLCAPLAKPSGPYWLNRDGIAAWLDDAAPSPAHLVAGKDLWATDTRVGIRLNPASRTVIDGALFSTDAVAPRRRSKKSRGDFGFLVGVSGATGFLPNGGLVRLGGDGRAASVVPAAPPPPPDFDAIADSGKFRLLLVTPGLFPTGWRPFDSDTSALCKFPGGSARLCAAAVPRHNVVSGWDLARWEPKPALRAAPAGSVYWFDQLQGGADAVRGLQMSGLLPGEVRTHEGFNHCWIGAWK